MDTSAAFRETSPATSPFSTMATPQVSNCRWLLGGSLRLAVGTATHAGIGAGASVAINYSSFLGTVSALSCAVFTSVDYLVSKLASPIFASMKESDACKDSALLYYTVAVVQFLLPKAIAVAVCAAAGLSLSFWQFVALAVAHAVLPYLALLGAGVVAYGIITLLKYTDGIDLFSPEARDPAPPPPRNDTTDDMPNLLYEGGGSSGGVQQGDDDSDL